MNKQINREIVSHYLGWLSTTRNRSKGTIVSYRHELLTWLDFLQATHLRNATPKMVEEFTNRKRSGRAGSNVAAPATRTKTLDILNAFYKWACLSEPSEFQSNPVLLCGKPKVHARQPRALSDETQIRVMNFALDSELLWLSFGWYFGLRREEMARLTSSHIDLNSGQVRNLVRKGGSEDTIPYRKILLVFQEALPQLVWNRFEEVLETHVTNRTAVGQPLFAWFPGEAPKLTKEAKTRYGEDTLVEPNVLNRRLNTILKRAGIQNEFSPHALRHTACSNLLRAKVPLHIVSGLMDHSSPEITMRYTKSAGTALDEFLTTR